MMNFVRKLGKRGFSTRGGDIFTSEQGDLTVLAASSPNPAFAFVETSPAKYADLLAHAAPSAVSISFLTKSQLEIDLDALRSVGSLERLQVEMQSPQPLRMRHKFEDFARLKQIEIRGPVSDQFPDVDDFPHVTSLKCDDQSVFRTRWVHSKKLLNLQLYNLKQPTLELLGTLENLQRLCLVQGQMHSLDGIQKLRRLKILHVAKAPKLEIIDAITASRSLEHIMFESYKRTTDWNFLAKKTDWISICIDTAADIEFVRQLPRLRYFWCQKIVSRNLAPLKDRPEIEHAPTGAGKGATVFYGDIESVQ